MQKPWIIRQNSQKKIVLAKNKVDNSPKLIFYTSFGELSEGLSFCNGL